MNRTPVYLHLLRAKAELIEAGLAGNVKVQDHVNLIIESVDKMLAIMDIRPEAAYDDSEYQSVIA